MVQGQPVVRRAADQRENVLWDPKGILSVRHGYLGTGIGVNKEEKKKGRKEVGKDGSKKGRKGG